VLLSIPNGAELGSPWPAIAILSACFFWGLDNNLTRKIALNDATWLAAVKGLVAGPVNLILAFALGATLPSPGSIAAALIVGFFAYGVSLALFIIGMRHVGTARAGAYFSIAPFLGAILALILGDPLTWQLLAAGALMVLGVWLHLTERHAHEHTHQPVTHTHWHIHDDGHHTHHHVEPVPPGTAHEHEHSHALRSHTHEHFPASHHRHSH
jgi:drug/metabolite transporter (DMT)-like permease